MPQSLQVRDGYELWHPNREKAESKTTKAIVAFVLLISAALLVIITLGGWERLQSTTVGVMTIAWAALYVLFAFLVMRWNRGVLPVAAALAVIMIIFAAVAANDWEDGSRSRTAAVSASSSSRTRSSNSASRPSTSRLARAASVTAATRSCTRGGRSTRPSTTR